MVTYQTTTRTRALNPVIHNFTESASLLRDADAEEADLNGEAHPSFAERITSAVQEPLTPLTKVLLIATLILLLLSSVFIGLFAGAQHKLNSPSGGDGDKEPPVTVTATTTDVSTTTAVYTTTAIPAPLPVPTKSPADVSRSLELSL